MMQQTRNGRVTDEFLVVLEGWSTRHRTSYPVQINNYTLLALLNEVHEHRDAAEQVEGATPAEPPTRDGNGHPSPSEAPRVT